MYTVEFVSPQHIVSIRTDDLESAKQEAQLWLDHYRRANLSLYKDPIIIASWLDYQIPLFDETMYLSICTHGTNEVDDINDFSIMIHQMLSAASPCYPNADLAALNTLIAAQ